MGDDVVSEINYDEGDDVVSESLTYQAWENSGMDMDEEEEDMEADAAAAAEEEEEEDVEPEVTASIQEDSSAG